MTTESRPQWPQEARTVHDRRIDDFNPTALAHALPAQPIVVGFSGGLDSGVLLHALAALPAARAHGLRALHVHHGLHPDADGWAAHCQRICAELGLALHVARVSVDHDLGIGLEAAARHARYAAFRAQLAEHEVLALAHHQDDQAETVLLRLLRASGSDGLAAMQQWRGLAPNSIWRPLLKQPRAALLAYAQANALHWIDDPSNAVHGPDRNFLRHQVLPLLRQRWPQAGAALARSAELLAEDAQSLRSEAAARLAGVLASDPATVSVTALLAQPAPWRARLLRLWIEQQGLPPLRGGAIAIIESQLLHARTDAQPQYRWQGVRMQRWRDLLHVGIEQQPLPVDWQATWDTHAPLQLPDGSRLQLDTPFDSPVLVRARRGGERIRLPGRSHHHSLRHVLQQQAVPPWQRERLPLLFAADGELLAAGDGILSARWQAWQEHSGARLGWISP
jgi:tRNA(Ile)-lysidine synthase